MKIPQKIEFIDIRLVADGDKFRKTEIPVGGKVKYRSTQGPALGDEGNITGFGHAGRKTGIQPDIGKGIDYAQTVGADQPDVSLPAEGDNFIFDSKAIFADFPKPGRDDDDPLGSLFNGLLGGCQCRPGGQDNHGQIHAVRNFSNVWVGPYAGNRAGSRVYRIQGAPVTSL